MIFRVIALPCMVVPKHRLDLAKFESAMIFYGECEGRSTIGLCLARVPMAKFGKVRKKFDRIELKVTSNM